MARIPTSNEETPGRGVRVTYETQRNEQFKQEETADGHHSDGQLSKQHLSEQPSSIVAPQRPSKTRRTVTGSAELLVRYICEGALVAGIFGIHRLLDLWVHFLHMEETPWVKQLLDDLGFGALTTMRVILFYEIGSLVLHGVFRLWAKSRGNDDD